jgi:iron complex transport system ATP-binding protein
MTNESIGLRNVDFSYNSRPVLKNVSLSVHKGEAVSIIGPNGAGKSTLIKIAMGFLSPGNGTVEIDGRPVKEWPPIELARYCAYVPQQPVIPSAFSVWETVFLGRSPYLGLLGIPGKKDREIVEQSLVRTEIGHLRDRKINELSGGERQRVIIARTLAQEPHCLLLDEPTHSLDMHHQVGLLTFIRELVEEQRVSVLFVLHDLNLASTFSDRIVLLSEGKIAAQGNPGQVLETDTIVSVYRQSITVFPRPDDETRPAVLPVKTIKKRTIERNNNG